ncbi:hypothetical protein [Pseudarthrobacter phenanthrenivorans]|uniref:hypothetical protein n=1 Tax=Pseudarthrobacter phenanthrenivorans TaxID=361575 RepID=UPI002F34F03E
MSLTALAIVATITKADALSVVALALAVLAFVVQIIVFIVQGNAASQQAADTAALNAQTLRALATIEEKSEGTRETVVKMNDRLLDFAFTKARLEAESAESANGNDSITGQVLERAKEILHGSQSAASGSGSIAVIQSAHRAPTKGTDGGSKPRSVEPSFLDGPLTVAEIAEVEELIKTLDASGNRLPILSLHRLGQDLRQAEKAGRPEQAGMSSINVPNLLHEHGLLRRVKPDWTEKPVFVLTEKGKLVAKALLISPPPLSDLVVNARRYIEDFNASIAKDRAAAQRRVEDIPIES